MKQAAAAATLIIVWLAVGSIEKIEAAVVFGPEAYYRDSGAPESYVETFNQALENYLGMAVENLAEWPYSRLKP